MLELLKQPWHWLIAGTLIGLTVPILLILGNKKFGISSSLRHICAVCFLSNISFFKDDWKAQIWNLFFVAGEPANTNLFSNPTFISKHLNFAIILTQPQKTTNYLSS